MVSFSILKINFENYCGNIFLGNCFAIPLNISDIEICDVSNVAAEHVRVLEADTFWCFHKLLDGIQDNYLFAQPGIQTKVNVLKDIVTRVNSKLHTSKLFQLHDKSRLLTQTCKIYVFTCSIH